MPHKLDRYHVEPNPLLHGAISLSLTSTVTHPPDPTSTIDVALLIDEGMIVSEPLIEVSISHA